MSIAFIGGGVMAEALIGGAIQGNVARPEDVVATDILEARREYLTRQYGISTTDSNEQAVKGAEFVILAVKPQVFAQVAVGLKGRLTPEQTVLSIMAGVTIRAISQGLGHEAVVRVMPNTPAQEGVGMSAWTASKAVSHQAKETARSLLRTMGEEVEVHREDYLDMATAVSGSGPAYVFTFAEAIIDAAVQVGLPRDIARKLALQTILGSVVLMQKRDLHPAVLRDMVTSPGGTTAEALLALERGGFRAAIGNAVEAAYLKSKALGEQA